MKDEEDEWQEFHDELMRGQTWWRAFQYTTLRRIDSVRHTPRRVRMFMQRGRRGWSDEDVWQLDHHLSSILAGGVAQLRTEVHGHPVEVCDPGCSYTEQCGGMERWERILEEIADGFELYRADTWSSGFIASEEEQERMDRAMFLFAKHFRSLND